VPECAGMSPEVSQPTRESDATLDPGFSASRLLGFAYVPTGGVGGASSRLSSREAARRSRGGESGPTSLGAPQSRLPGWAAPRVDRRGLNRRGSRPDRARPSRHRRRIEVPRFMTDWQGGSWVAQRASSEWRSPPHSASCSPKTCELRASGPDSRRNSLRGPPGCTKPRSRGSKCPPLRTRTQRRHPRLDQNLERPAPTVRLNQDRRPNPRIHRPILHAN